MRSWLIVAMIAGGCAGDDSTGGPVVAFGEFRDRYREALCTHLVTCHEFADQATCLATELGEAVALDPIAVRDVMAGITRYDGSTVATCFAALAARTCNPGDLANRRPVAQCLLHVLSGTRHDAETCQLDSECISGACKLDCAVGTECCAGTCDGDTAPHDAPLTSGAQCPQGTGSFDACAVGLYCDATTSVCTPVKAEGKGCATTKECADGLQCDVTNTPNVCARAPQLGDSCSSNGGCGDEGTYCLNNLCTAYSLAGEPCLGQQCSSYTYCELSTRTCVPYPAEGASCASANRCNDVGTFCDSHDTTCKQPVANGIACEISSGCESGYCDRVKDFVCKDPPSCL